MVDVGDDGKISDFRLVGQKNTPPKDGEWSSNIGVYPQEIPGGQAAGASPRPTEQGNDRGPGRRTGSPSPTHTRGDRLGISGAWHRWRPGGRTRYSAAALRACGVTAMRAARGAASSAQATDRSLSGRPESSFPPLGPCSRRGIAIPGPKWPANRAAPFFRLALSATGGASPGNSPHRTRCAAVGGFAALRMRRAPCGYFAGLRRGPQLPQAPANGAGGNARSVYALSVQPTAAVSPRFGGRRGNTPGPFFPPISSGRNGGARRVGGAGGASDKNPAKPPSKKRRVPRGGTHG